MPWVIRYSPYLLNRYAIHSAICEFGETVLYMLPTIKNMPKMEARFFVAIWLGKDTSRNKNIVDIPHKVVRLRTIRRQVKPDKYITQMMDIINSTPWTTSTGTGFVLMPKARATQRKQRTTSTTSAETQRHLQQEQQLSTPTTAMTTPSRTITDLPMTTALTTQQKKTPLPTPAKREVTDKISEGSATKQHKTEEHTIATQ